MVVIVIIGILAVLAAPAASAALDDRRAFDDAGAIMQLFRTARMRAIARGGAELVMMTSNGTTDRGTFALYEAVVLDALGGGRSTAASTCKAPTVWTPIATTNPNIQLIDTARVRANDQTTFNSYSLSTSLSSTMTTFSATGSNTGYICYTPLGRSFASVGTGAMPVFDGLVPTTSPLEIVVQRFDAGSTTVIGTSRSVLVPPNGMARLFSHL